MSWTRRDQRLAYDAVASAWPGLSFDDRQDLVDVMSTYDFDIAFDILLKSSTIDADIADRIRYRA